MATEKRLIDANALKANFPTQVKFAEDLWPSEAVRKVIDNAPTVDAVEVVHGRWIPKTYDSEPYQFILQHCSECGAACALERNFCSYCGASMKDGDGNG